MWCSDYRDKSLRVNSQPDLTEDAIAIFVTKMQPRPCVGIAWTAGRSNWDKIDIRAAYLCLSRRSRIAVGLKQEHVNTACVLSYDRTRKLSA